MKRTALFALLICLFSFTRAQKLLYTAPLGVEAYTFRKSFPLNVTATLDTIRMMGFTEIEGGGGVEYPPKNLKNYVMPEASAFLQSEQVMSF